jgi:hypothetical protein
MKPLRLVVPVLTLLAGGTHEAAAQVTGRVGGAKTPDATVERQIKAADLAYKVDDDGDFKITYAVPGGNRTQLVFVISHTESVGGLAVREVWSPAFKTGGALSQADAVRMLTDNNAKKVGAWRLYATADKQAVVFAIQLAANASAEAMKSAIGFVAEVADGLEEEKTNADVY